MIWLKSQGIRHDEIARLAGVSNKTLYSYLKAYAESGFAGAGKVSFHRPQSQLIAYQSAIAS
ncbi:MAG: helix-turn-helix domain-containing protein, partial [Methylococcaceae bacterium]|nr:helix-turn-helix domain-containing protein [Methylococcaceae bacterium]